MSETDHAFDVALSQELEQGNPIRLTKLEGGDWTKVCAVGEDRPSNMMEEKPRPGERAFHEFIDAGSFYFGGGGRGALAFVYPDGVEVRPLTDLIVNMGSPINTCVLRTDAGLVHSPELGWHFVGHEAES